MRSVSIIIHNNQVLEVFVEKRERCFELWVVGTVKERRVLFDHHLTHDDLESRLAYAQAGDLIWRDAKSSEIPTEKHKNAIQMEEAIRQGTFIDFEKQGQSVANHFYAIDLLPMDRKQFNLAKKAILGCWTDGIATISLEPDSKLIWSCPINQPHVLNLYARVDGHIPDWWNFALWQLPLMNDEHKCGMRISVLRVDDDELHVSGGQMNRLAYVFRRVKASKSLQIGKTTRGVMASK